VRNRRRVVYYTILLLLILGGLLGERNYIIIIFPEYDINTSSTSSSCFSSVSVATKMLSMKVVVSPLFMRSQNRLFIIVWKVAEELVNPKYITVDS